MSEKIVVTGGAGFIGSHIVEKLVGRGFEVSIFDNFSTGYIENIKSVKDRVKIVRGDIRCPEEVQKAVSGAKAVFHMAAFSYAEESIKKPEEYNRVNIDGTFNVLQACHKESVQRVIFPSTCLVYGANAASGKLEESLPLNTTNPYGLTKVTGENYCRVFTEVYGLETVCYRIFNAYGPRMQNRVISKFAALMFQDKPPIINGNGEQKRDFIFVSDIVDGLITGIDAKKSQCGKSYNIGTGKGLNLKKLIKLMNMHMGKNVDAIYKDRVKGETDLIIADTALARKELGFAAKIGFNEGIKITMDWLKEDYPKGPKF
ncbi:MAG: SDR family NAD(P)-dependent oxidoreductase [archaeon]|nr:SDR family NAD(P)-dependent oxidoreductase [archaeon]